MALYTDRAVFGLEDLASQESGLADVTAAERINLTSKIELAREEVGLELLAWLRRLPAAEGQSIALDRVVVTAPLRLWQVFHTLEIVYRDAYHNQLNDRYKGKWQEYRELSRWAASMLGQIGVGVVANPLPEALVPAVDTMAGTLGEGDYFVRIAWTNAAGEEGAASPLGAVAVGSGETFRVTAAMPPSGATGYRVWAGTDPNRLFLQTPSAIAAGTAFTAAGESIVTDTRGPAAGQEPTYLRQMPRVFQRG